MGYINMIGRKTGISKAQVLALGPTLFLDADSVSGADGDAIGTWSDESGNDAHFTEATNKPLLKKAANGINGHNVLRFDGSNDVMTCAKELSELISASADTIYIVFRIFAITTNNVSGYNDGAFLHAYRAICFRTSTGINAVIYDTSYKLAAKAISTSTAYISRSRHSSGTLYIRINGDAEGSVAAGNVAALTSAPKLANDGYGSVAQIDLAEVIIFNSALSADSMAIVDAYLKAKYATY